GVSRFARGEAVGAGLHLLDPESGEYNVSAVAAAAGRSDAVLLEWAGRTQGLVVAAGNPLGLGSLADAVNASARIALRQEAAGSRILLAHLMEREGLQKSDLSEAEETARSEMDVGLAIMEGRADAGLAIEAVARSLKLEFVPLAEERYDLLLSRPDYFDPPLQTLMNFARSPAFAERARRMGGYDVENLGRVRFNSS
ncbi:MAG: substrate-binding domain-containing protein, partial [Rhodovibrionaceae bacterium]|nr:substrate-binding domain-containing protein [Rhodovibrionaceae bacterium]